MVEVEVVNTVENKKVQVSIIMNCYNSDFFLKEAINSVINQSYQDWELIFWDNQSTDNSASIVKSFKDTRIKYILAPEHTPLGRARNLAVEKATADWIAFLDSDDLWDKNKLNLSIEALSENTISDDISLIYNKSVVINESNEEIYKINRAISGNIHKYLLINGNFIVQSSIMLNKRVFDKVGGINENLKFCPDYDILLKITKNSKAIGINEYLTSYRVHENNITNTKRYDNDTEVVRFLEDYIVKNSIDGSLKRNIFINNSYRIGSLFIKLLIGRDYKDVVRVVANLPLYLLFFPISVVYHKIKGI